jgi:glyoxylate utilization-related uncharacterized protein
VLIEKGTIHAHVGDQERDLHAGGTVFIPQHTWVDLKNTGTEPASIVAILQFQVFHVGLARLYFSSGNSDVMVPAHCFSLSVELAQILRCRYRV